jgi:hypothetical protein
VEVTPKSSYEKRYWSIKIEDCGREHIAQSSSRGEVSELKFDGLLQFLSAYLTPGNPA